jgi:hypothetical protein
MNKGWAAMWVDPKTWGAGLLGLGLIASACGKAGTTESGETHFLISCEDECPGQLECLCGVCSKPCDDDASCSSLGERATCVVHELGTCTTVTKSCDVECASDRDCSSQGAANTCQAGLCREPGQPGVGGSSSGGTDSGGSSGSGTGGQAGEGGNGGAGGLGGATSTGPACGNCAESDCATNTTCSLEEACTLVSCNSALFDETGCYRPSCVADDGCQTNARCTTDSGTAETRCEETGESCGCSSIVPTEPRRVCSPSALAGPRGEWLSIDIHEGGNLDERGATDWSIQADGDYFVKVTPPGDSGGQPTENTGQLSAEDLSKLRLWIEGPDLRRILAVGDTCTEETILDYVVDVTLHLDTGSIGKNVTACTLSPPRTSGREPFPSLLALAKNY